MNHWRPLLPAAMVGTDRQAPPGAAAWPGEIGVLAKEALDTAPDPATGALRLAAVLAACGLAGARGADVDAAPAAPAAADDTPPLPEGPLVDGLLWTLREGPQRLLHELLLRLHAQGLRLPHRLLPLALDQGRRSLALRPALSAVLGARGLWLAAQREDWRYAAGVAAQAEDDESLWTEGSAEQRLAFLRGERQRDPAAARQRLQAALAQMPARERAELAGALAVNLSPADEALVEELRADRSREVQQLALNLLLRLPEAAAVQRAQARMAGLLRQERGLLLNKRWVVEPPTEAGADWKAERLDAPRPKQDSLGERGWWLYQHVRQVPLAWWSAQLGLDAGELIAWSEKSDWREALQRGWRDALAAAPVQAWVEAVLRGWPQTLLLADDQASLLALLPAEARERHWQRAFAATPDKTTLFAVLGQALAGCAPGQTLSAALSQALVKALLQEIGAGILNNDYALRASLPELACVLHPQALAPLGRLPAQAEASPGLLQSLQTLSQVVHVRLAFLPSSSATP